MHSRKISLVWPFCTAALLDTETLTEDNLKMRTIPPMGGTRVLEHHVRQDVKLVAPESPAKRQLSLTEKYILSYPPLHCQLN